jgi:foldase protein PrsA
MKKKIIILGACTMLLCGCGKIPTLSNGDEAVVKFENGDMISVNELYQEIKDNYALQSLLQMIDKKILETEYKDEVESKKEVAESTVKAMKESYGEDQFLQMLQSYYGYSSIEAYQNAYYISALQNLAIVDYGKSLVTEKEMKKYYDESVFGDILVSHILITADTTSNMSTEEKTAAENKAKDQVKSLIDELKKSDNKKEKFTQLAKEYSKDESTKENGGSLGYINIGTLGTSYDEIVKAANSLKNGEISTEVITTELGYHVILREEQKEKASYEDTEESIKTTLGEKKISADSTLSVTALTELRKKYGMDIVDSEIQKQYGNYISNTIANIEASKNNSTN